MKKIKTNFSQLFFIFFSLFFFDRSPSERPHVETTVVHDKTNAEDFFYMPGKCAIDGGVTVNQRLCLTDSKVLSTVTLKSLELPAAPTAAPAPPWRSRALFLDSAPKNEVFENIFAFVSIVQIIICTHRSTLKFG